MSKLYEPLMIITKEKYKLFNWFHSLFLSIIDQMEDMSKKYNPSKWSEFTHNIQECKQTCDELKLKILDVIKSYEICTFNLNERQELIDSMNNCISIIEAIAEGNKKTWVSIRRLIQ